MTGEIAIQPVGAFHDAPERDAIARILAEAGLPAPEGSDPAHYLVARDGPTFAGCIGWEPRGDAALLRSLAVAPARRRQGLATRLVGALLEALGGAGCRTVYLLTESARPWFEARGFEVVPRADVPLEVQRSSEFRIHRCDDAVSMRRALRTGRP